MGERGEMGERLDGGCSLGEYMRERGTRGRRWSWVRGGGGVRMVMKGWGTWGYVRGWVLRVRVGIITKGVRVQFVKSVDPNKK